MSRIASAAQVLRPIHIERVYIRIRLSRVDAREWMNEMIKKINVHFEQKIKPTYNGMTTYSEASSNGS